MDRVLGPPSERLLQLLPVEVQVDRVRREAPVGPGGQAVAERLHEADLLPLEPELDARAGERVGPWALPLHPGLADEHGQSGGLIELHRVAARREIAPVDGDRKSTRLNSSHSQISYAVFCL